MGVYTLGFTRITRDLTMKHIVSFSGGKDSTAMLLMMIEKQMPIDYVLYIDTTKDFPQTYEHMERFNPK